MSSHDLPEESSTDPNTQTNPYAPDNLGHIDVVADDCGNAEYPRMPLSTAVLHALDAENLERISAEQEGDDVLLRPDAEGELGDWAAVRQTKLGPSVVDALGVHPGDQVVAHEQGDRVRLEAEVEIVDDGTLVADGGVAWTDLTAFQRDLLEAVRRLENAGETVYGLAIKREVERLYGEDINHGRLYPNLDDLVDADLLEKGELDKRTNSYELTSSAQSMLEHRARLLADACGMEQPVADGGEN